MAEHATSADQKRRLLRVAEGWLDLANRSQKRRSSPATDSDDHPMVKAKLGDRHTGV